MNILGMCRWIEFNGERLTLSGWARKLGLSHKSLEERLNNWPLEKALTTPPIRPLGVRKMKEHKSWEHMKHRCNCPSFISYHRYGGRGIRVCAEWLNDFWAFYRHIGPAPGKGRFHSVDRINPDGHYEPGNVRWATPATQSANRAKNKAHGATPPK